MKIKKGKLYELARTKLNLTRNAAAVQSGIPNKTIQRIENNIAEKINPDYTEYLVRNGVNYFYLIGESEEIKGQKIDGITRAEHESLQQNFDELEKNYQELENRYNLLERVLQLLQIEVDEQGNVKQKK